MTRYKTNRPLWFYASFSLFLICWFIPYLADKQEYVSPARLIWELIEGIFNSDNVTIEDVFLPLIIFTLLFGIPSILIGWLIQCVVMVIRHKKTKAN
jgi:hypothetical protein